MLSKCKQACDPHLLSCFWKATCKHSALLYNFVSVFLIFLQLGHQGLCVIACRSVEDVEDVRREVQIMHHLAGHPNVTLLKGAYEDRHHVHLVCTAHSIPLHALDFTGLDSH